MVVEASMSAMAVAPSFPMPLPLQHEGASPHGEASVHVKEPSHPPRLPKSTADPSRPIKGGGAHRQAPVSPDDQYRVIVRQAQSATQPPSPCSQPSRPITHTHAPRGVAATGSPDGGGRGGGGKLEGGGQSLGGATLRGSLVDSPKLEKPESYPCVVVVHV